MTANIAASPVAEVSAIAQQPEYITIPTQAVDRSRRNDAQMLGSGRLTNPTTNSAMIDQGSLQTVMSDEVWRCLDTSEHLTSRSFTLPTPTGNEQTAHRRRASDGQFIPCPRCGQHHVRISGAAASTMTLGGMLGLQRAGTDGTGVQRNTQRAMRVIIFTIVLALIARLVYYNALHMY
jgi:hypothetical protein